ncbi:divergent PAP2 family protein [Thermospira aquatica]|uniref:Divergent PAP2 family protein n=1 Tax=Thermospira aquatica TaxID=2828656 RepID=A0AAX3BC09_9SPIR|nr:divergent PAP2 family protein [Thermospira aquatica]URA09831.1 divergent PAP2 family protein [Thermospira aquatica]
MRVLFELLHNKVLLPALCAQLSSQLFKIIRTWIKAKEIRLDHIAQYGDFPSAHTAFIVSGTLMAGLVEGWQSAVFALGVIFSSIVISDALVQRKALEKTQEAVESLAGKKIFNPPFRGHTGKEILAGAVIGIIWVVFFSIIWQV